MSSVRGRGRPPMYTGHVERHIACLLRQYNGKTVRNILNASSNASLSRKRNKHLVPTPLNISQPTVNKIAKNNNISLIHNRGRKRLAA